MRSLVVGLSVLLVSCGGGGTGDGSPPPAPPPSSNQPPTITSLTFAATEDRDFAGAMTATDPEGTTVTFTRTSDPAHGQVTSFTAAGAFTYRPAANFTGADSFIVRATDAANAQVTATITVNVANGDDDAPILRTDILQATGANPLVDVLANDEEPDGEALTLTLVGNPDFGSATVENRRIRFNLPAAFKGFNRFQYRAVDSAGQGGVVKAVVFVDAQPSRLVYFSSTSAANGYSNVFIDDFVSTRKMTSRETATDGLSMNRFVRGQSGSTIIVMYKEDSRYVPFHALDVIATDGSFPIRRITPPRVAGVTYTYDLVSEISPDGRWVVYKQQRGAFEERYFLAELTQNGVSTELALPAGALAVADSPILFGPGSQYFYASVLFQFPNLTRGSAIYRYSLANPAAAPQLVSPVAREDLFLSATRISPDEARILFTEYRQGDVSPSLRILTIANPSAAITLSHTLGTQERISGQIHTNAQFSRVYYPTEDGVDPNATFRLYGADTAMGGSGALIATLPPAQWRPEIWELSPDESSVLFTAPVLMSGQAYDRASTLALTPGSQPHVLVEQLRWLPLYNFIDAGRFVLYGTGSSISRVTSTGTPSHVLVASNATSGYSLARDGAYVAYTYSDILASPPSNHLWLANTMATGGVQQVQFSGVGDPTAYVSTWGFIPAQ
jgi:hypothetical protein